MDAETTPAFLDFKLVFKATDEPVKYEDATRHTGSPDSRPMRNSTCNFAVMGEEVNGKYYPDDKRVRSKGE
jgi:hypothetical protein